MSDTTILPLTRDSRQSDARLVESLALSDRFPTRTEAEAELTKALAECLRPCCEGTVRHARVQRYLNWQAIAKAVDVLEGVHG